MRRAVIDLASGGRRSTKVPLSVVVVPMVVPFTTTDAAGTGCT